MQDCWLTSPVFFSNLFPSLSPSSRSGVGWPWTHSASLSSPSRWPASSPSSGSSTKSAPGCPRASAPASSASATSRRWNGTQGDLKWTRASRRVWILPHAYVQRRVWRWWCPEGNCFSWFQRYAPTVGPHISCDTSIWLTSRLCCVFCNVYAGSMLETEWNVVFFFSSLFIISTYKKCCVSDQHSRTLFSFYRSSTPENCSSINKNTELFSGPDTAGRQSAVRHCQGWRWASMSLVVEACPDPCLWLFGLIERSPELVWERNPSAQLSKSVNKKKKLRITTTDYRYLVAWRVIIHMSLLAISCGLCGVFKCRFLSGTEATVGLRRHFTSACCSRPHFRAGCGRSSLVWHHFSCSQFHLTSCSTNSPISIKEIPSLKL